MNGISIFGVDFEFVFYLTQLVMWFFAFVFAIVSIIKSIVKSVKAKKQLKETIQELDENKKNQEEKEKEMAKFYFLCDKCGNQTSAENGKKLTFNGKMYDLCPNCDTIVRTKINNVSQAKRDFENAQIVYNNQKTKLNELQKDLETCINKTSDDVKIKEVDNKANSNDIRNVLGI